MDNFEDIFRAEQKFSYFCIDIYNVCNSMSVSFGGYLNNSAADDCWIIDLPNALIGLFEFIKENLSITTLIQLIKKLVQL